MVLEKIILVKGGSYSDVKKALQQWIDLYSESISDSFQFELYKNGKGNHVIKADTKLGNERFYYLVNYIKYPEGINYNVDVEGVTKGENGSSLDGENLLVYIPKNDSEYDNIYVVTENNEHYKIDFGGKVKSVSDTKVFSTLKINALENPQTLKVSSNKSKLKTTESSNLKIEKRFRLISIIAIAVAILNLLIPVFTTDIEIFEKTTLFLGIGFGVWFLSDYIMLRVDHYYFKSLLIAIGYLGYGHYLCNYYQPEISDTIEATSLFPLSLLLVQWPTRRIYKTIFNREPEVEKHGKFADLVYSMILFLGFALLPYLLYDYLK
jgi:hypothetical protein